ncbi:MAG: phosphoribosyl-AMP cyclohydrolase [Anaerolineales bacterium]|nr:phosphoribosyl-AMP cyclohydrolase [Anaerolineales bacterium]MCS7248482.1 phosphoribosyl-AMP cyclohydrolase [Anaerolineales bacterium]MDW8162295.1 phosphoribosyl-AMP cyclohydrolase [Anaerolineales bacterium]MDW8448086.1 phosphoribosyl-AMP cyclohydrolase [Anaerolineales bacterium]
MMKFLNLEELKFDSRGLLPVVVQDVHTREVLMLAYMNRQALELTLRSGEMVFWSRSRQSLWHKGETSGNVQRLIALCVDCDADCLLALVEPSGPACHTGNPTCFYRTLEAKEWG